VKTDAALLDAQRSYDAASADRARFSPAALKAREEETEALLLQAQEAHAAEQNAVDTDLQAAYAAHRQTMEAVIETLTDFCDARERLTDAEATLARLEARARRLGVQVPPYDSLALRASRDPEVNNVQHRARRVTVNGFYGTR
jgi:hypothetical protein